ncbi:MAG: ATP-binding protein, partial [Sarcina sp.]
NINAQRETMYKQIIALKDEATNKELILRNMLKDINLENIPLENIFEEINFLLKKLKDKNELEVNLKSAEKSYKILLKDRNVEDLKEELKNFIKSNECSFYKKEDDIEIALKEKNKELLDIEKEIKDVEHSINTSMLSTRALSVIEEELDNVKNNKEECEKKLKSVELALKYLDETFNEIQKNYGPILNKKVSKYFTKITSGKYNEVRVSPNYELLVRDNETKELINLEYLSNGSCDQVYLSLRLALIELIYSNEKVPIILDESFSQFDEKRLKEILKILCEISKEKQIILFSCQKREYEFFENNNEINVIKL